MRLSSSSSSSTSSSSSSTSSSSCWGREASAHALPAAIALLCYLNSLDGDFVHDDAAAVTGNPDVVRPSAPLSHLLVHDFWGQPMAHPASHKSYRPLTVLTFRLNVLFAGGELDVRGFHVVNVVLHAIVTVLVVRICRQILGWSRSKAQLAGIWFAVHPIHTEAVAGVVGRAEVLACLLFLVSLLLFDGEDDTPPARISMSVLAASLAMLAKEQGFTVLPLLLVHDVNRHWSHLRRSATKRCWSPECKAFVARTALVIGSMVVLLGYRFWMLGGTFPRFSSQDNPAATCSCQLTRILTFTFLPALNAWLMLLPARLAHDWQTGSVPLVSHLGDTRNYASILLLATLALLAVRATFRAPPNSSDRRSVFLGLCLLVLPFLPASNLMVTVGFVVAERVLYIPSVGFCILVVHGVSQAWLTLPHLRPAIRFGAALVLVLFAVKTIHRNRAWASRDTLLRAGLETLPHNAKLHFNFANLKREMGDTRTAILHYREALRLWPEHAGSHNNLGTLLVNGSHEQAVLHFTEAIRINPLHAHAHFNLAAVYRRQGELSTASTLLETAIKLNPKFVEAHASLAEVYAQEGRDKDAEDAYRALLRLAPANADALNNYGAFLQRSAGKYSMMEAFGWWSGREDAALGYYLSAVAVNANHTMALVNAARLLKVFREPGLAESLYKRALSLQPDPAILENLGALYMATGRLTEARGVFIGLLSQDPGNHICRVRLAQMLMLERDFSKAEKELSQVLSADPNHRDALHQMATLYNRLNRTTEAMEYILRALRSCDSSATCGQLHADHGDILKDLRDMDTAAESYKMALQANPHLSQAHHNLAVIYHIKKDFRQAWRHYRAAHNLEPQNTLLRENMAKLRRAWAADSPHNHHHHHHLHGGDGSDTCS